MRTIWFLLLSSLLFISPAIPREPIKFDIFLVKFRKLYDEYHFGTRLDQRAIDRMAVKVWRGSGGQYEYASTTACQGVFETHFDITEYVYGHRGRFGMRVNTIIVEGIRTGLISKSEKDKAWLLKLCRKDPSLADKLAASRLVYLNSLNKNMVVSLRVWVRGRLVNQTEKDLKDSKNYADGVLVLRKKMFGVAK